MYLYVFVCVYLCLCMYVRVCLHVFLVKRPLVISLQFKVGAHPLRFSYSTVVYISFPCLHVALNCKGEESDLLCEPCVTAVADGKG